MPMHMELGPGSGSWVPGNSGLGPASCTDPGTGRRPAAEVPRSRGMPMLLHTFQRRAVTFSTLI